MYIQISSVLLTYISVTNLKVLLLDGGIFSTNAIIILPPNSLLTDTDPFDMAIVSDVTGHGSTGHC